MKLFTRPYETECNHMETCIKLYETIHKILGQMGPGQLGTRQTVPGQIGPEQMGSRTNGFGTIGSQTNGSRTIGHQNK